MTMKAHRFFNALSYNAVEQQRFETLLSALRPWRDLFVGKRVFDFGCSSGLSAVAFIEEGAASVAGIEPVAYRVERGRRMIESAGLSDRVDLRHVEDTRHTGTDEQFDFVSAIAVFEHIPQPRDEYLRELWRITAPRGVLFIHETPNSLYPIEIHTTHGLWFNQWLPKATAHRRAVRRGRFDATRTDWDSSGWRGMHYYEMVRPLTGYKLLPELTRPRHRLLNAIGLPAGLIDPYPTWVIRKQ